MRPVRFEIAIREARVSIDVPVTDDEVIARTRLKKLLLHREPRGFVQPQLNFGKLLAHFIGFRQQFQQKNFAIVERFFALQRNRVTLFQGIPGSPEPKQQELIDDGFFLSQIVFLDAVNFRVVDVKIVAVTEDRSRIGLRHLDSHFVVAPHGNPAGFGGLVVHHDGHLGPLQIRRKAMEGRRLRVELFEDVFQRPIGL